MPVVFIRTILMYVLLIAAIRLMGKRQVGELEISELVITFMLSELAILPISDKGIPLLYAVIPILVLLSIEVILSFIISKSPKVKKIILGTPSFIINKGKLDTDVLSMLRMSPSELMSELRLKGISSLDEVQYAIIEDNGQLSVFKKASSSPVTPADIRSDVPENGIAHCLIVDGKIYDDNLALAGIERSEVIKYTLNQGFSPDNILLLTVDDAGKYNMIPKK